MRFDYEGMPKRNKEDSKGNIMRECNNCGNRTYMFYEEDENYKVVCEFCEEEHKFKANSMDRAMKIWKEMKLEADCEYCPLGWEERGYEGECYDCGCIVQEDIKWCSKTWKQREEKRKEVEQMEEYKIQSDYEAEQAVKRIARSQKEMLRLLDLAEMEQAELDLRKKEIKDRHETLLEVEQERLNQFLNNVDTKKTKTQEKYKLLSGEIVRTYPKKEIKANQDLIISNKKYLDYVEYQPKLKWAELKKTLKVVGDKIVDENGEEVKDLGFELEEKQSNLRIKFND